MLYLGNAFSGGMVIGRGTLDFSEIDEDEFIALAPHAKSVVGHANTANLLSKICDYTIPCNREAIHLEKGDVLLVAQCPVRLPGGTLELPPDVKFTFQRWELKSN